VTQALVRVCDATFGLFWKVVVSVRIGFRNVQFLSQKACQKYASGRETLGPLNQVFSMFD
jgi:hypothetical protein